MIVPDANLLIYAYDSTAPAHLQARAWWESVLSNPEPVGLPWVVVLVFVRLMSHPILSENPMTPDQARACVSAWLSYDHVRLLSVGPATLQRFFDLLQAVGTAGNLCTDALIPATAGEHGSTV